MFVYIRVVKVIMFFYSNIFFKVYNIIINLISINMGCYFCLKFNSIFWFFFIDGYYK